MKLHSMVLNKLCAIIKNQFQYMNISNKNRENGVDTYT